MFPVFDWTRELWKMRSLKNLIRQPPISTLASLLLLNITTQLNMNIIW